MQMARGNLRIIREFVVRILILMASGVMPTAKAVDPFETPFTLGGAAAFRGRFREWHPKVEY